MAINNLPNDSAALFHKLQNWQAKHEANIIAAQQRMDNPDELAKFGEDSIYNDYLQKESKIGSFDFMEGKNPEDKEEYGAQLHKLAKEDFEYSDFDGDGKVTLDEFIDHELSSLTEEDDEDMEISTRAAAYLIFSIMDQAMGNSDSNGSLSVEEYESLYKNLDLFNGSGFDEQGDGIISPEAINMSEWLIENMISEDAVESAIKLAMQGDI